MSKAVVVLPYLNDRTKTEVTNCLKRIVDYVRPCDVGQKVNQQSDMDVNAYVAKLVTYLKGYDDALSGEKLFVLIEESGKKKKNAIPKYTVSERLKTSKFTDPDWVWVTSELTTFATARKFADYTEMTSRIVAESDNHGWITWKMEDCVFAAILKVLGLKFKGTGGTVEAAEETVERKLAGLLGVPQKMVQDEVLRMMIEKTIGWPLVAGVSTVGTLNAKTTNGKYYLITYCTNAQADSWHVVLGLKGSASDAWTIYDRQKERQGKTGALPDASMEAVGWEVSDSSKGMAWLKRELDVDTLKETYKSHLA